MVGRARSEYSRWQDDGCEVAPHCLNCPLPRCRYDEPSGLRSIERIRLHSGIIQARQEGLPVDAIAERFDVSRRSVFRVLKEQRESKRDYAEAPRLLNGR